LFFHHHVISIDVIIITTTIIIIIQVRYKIQSDLPGCFLFGFGDVTLFSVFCFLHSGLEDLSAGNFLNKMCKKHC